MRSSFNPDAFEQQPLKTDGFVLLKNVFSAEAIAHLLSVLESGLSEATRANDPAIRGSEGTLYAARNLTHLLPETLRIWQVPRLTSILGDMLGSSFGMVRCLYFDKPPGNSWALPWHKDTTIAVKNNRLPSKHFSKPTQKAGIPHVEAPTELLATMLTARIHLDDVDDDNGRLKIITRSHLTGKELVLDASDIVTIKAKAGDVLLMRPLLTHCSNRSKEGCTQHRRTLHLEFASMDDLPDGYEWFEFHRASNEP